MGAQNAETRAATWFCVYGHEHAAIAEAQACDTKWDNAWKGSVCGLHDAGLPMSCTCTPTQSDGCREGYDHEAGKDGRCIWCGKALVSDGDVR